MSGMGDSIKFRGAGPIIVDGRRYPAWSEEALSWGPAVAAWRELDPAMRAESFNAIVCRIREAWQAYQVGRGLTDAIFCAAQVVGVDWAAEPSRSVEWPL